MYTSSVVNQKYSDEYIVYNNDVKGKTPSTHGAGKVIDGATWSSFIHGGSDVCVAIAPVWIYAER